MIKKTVGQSASEKSGNTKKTAPKIVKTVGQSASEKSGNMKKAARKIVKTVGQSASEKWGNMKEAERKIVKDGSATVESMLPTGSPERVAVGVAAAAGGALLAAATLGVGPVALAGAAGYLAYRGMTGKRKDD
jgi:hypothetical protein